MAPSNLSSELRTRQGRQAEADEATEELLQIPGFLEAYERADDESRTGRLTPIEELRREKRKPPKGAT